MRKNEEIREKRLGQLSRSGGNAIYQNKVRMELFQMAEITAEKVKCGCINTIREGKCYPFLLI
jgi:hypothetical protein